MKHQPIVYCRWYDAVSAEPGWVPREDLNTELAICHTAGFVAHEDADKITIISSYNDGEDVSQSTTIPKPWIIELKRLKKNGNYE